MIEILHPYYDAARIAQLTDASHRELVDMWPSAIEELRALDALDALEIAHIGDRMPGTLSSGQTQRVRLAQALVRPWDLLLLDEPEQRLDVDGRAWLGRFLRECADDGGGILMASHDATLLDASGARTVMIGR